MGATVAGRKLAAEKISGPLIKIFPGRPRGILWTILIKSSVGHSTPIPQARGDAVDLTETRKRAERKKPG